MLTAAVVSLGLLTQLGLQAGATQTDSSGFIRGLDPAFTEQYRPDAEGSWKCLDGSKTIPFSAVNDDFCDCSDGSDEPGTSACENSTFYCRNEGHIPGMLFASRVNDGICDPECCDGSDEWQSGVSCPNTCLEKGKAYREQLAVESKVRKTGSKIRSSYITFAKQERGRLEAKLGKLKKDAEVKEADLAAAKIKLAQYESADKDYVERKKKSPLYISLMEHRRVLNLLRTQADNTYRDLEILKGIMQDLSESYNPNYQDMAVKHAVEMYQERHRVVASEPFTDMESGIDDHIKFEENSGHKEAIPYLSDEDLDAIENIDVTALLFEHKDDQDEEESSIFRIEQYIPDALFEHYETARDTLLMTLIKLGIIAPSATSTGHAEGQHTQAQRAAFLQAEQDLHQAEEDLKKVHDELEKFDTGYGPQAEWKKLENTCIEKEQGEYTYSLCFLGPASQKKGSSSTSLGHFEGWSRAPHASVGSEAYYSTQFYTHGARCWNGPDRQVKVELTCGRDNELLSISEPEKCEYLFKATSPALCWPDPAWEKERLGKEGEAQAKAEL